MAIPRLLACTLALVAACVDPALDPIDPIDPIDPPTPAADAPDDGAVRRLDALALAPLIVVARTRSNARTTETVAIDGQLEERPRWIAEIEIVRVLAGAAPATLRVISPATSGRAPLEPGRELVLSLYPTDAGRYRVDHSLRIVDGRVPRLDRTIEQLASDVKAVRDAR